MTDKVNKCVHGTSAARVCIRLAFAMPHDGRRHQDVALFQRSVANLAALNAELDAAVCAVGGIHSGGVWNLLEQS